MKDKNKTVYISSPISGCDPDETIARFKRMVETIQGLGYKVLSPVYDSDDVKRCGLKYRGAGDGSPRLTNRALFGRDKWMVEQSDIVFVNLLGCSERTSVGCVFEIAWAELKNKLVIVIMEEDNFPHRHGFITQAADYVFTKEIEGYDLLRGLEGEWVV